MALVLKVGSGNPQGSLRGFKGGPNCFSTNYYLFKTEVYLCMPSFSFNDDVVQHFKSPTVTDTIITEQNVINITNSWKKSSSDKCISQSES